VTIPGKSRRGLRKKTVACKKKFAEERQVPNTYYDCEATARVNLLPSLIGCSPALAPEPTHRSLLLNLQRNLSRLRKFVGNLSADWRQTAILLLETKDRVVYRLSFGSIIMDIGNIDVNKLVMTSWAAQRMSLDELAVTPQVIQDWIPELIVELQTHELLPAQA